MFRLLVVSSAFWIAGCGGSNTGVEPPKNPSQPPPDAKPENTGMQPPEPASVE
jgi:hypothetical protein